MGLASSATYVGLTATIGYAVNAETTATSAEDDEAASEVLALSDNLFDGSAVPAGDPDAPTTSIAALIEQLDPVPPLHKEGFDRATPTTSAASTPVPTTAGAATPTTAPPTAAAPTTTAYTPGTPTTQSAAPTTTAPPTTQGVTQPSTTQPPTTQPPTTQPPTTQPPTTQPPTTQPPTTQPTTTTTSGAS